MAWRASWGVWPSTPARLHTSLNAVLITLGVSRPSLWAFVAGDRNSAGDFHFSGHSDVKLPYVPKILH